MGTLFTRKKKSRFLLVGLDGAGKTTIVYKLMSFDTLSILPPQAFNMKTIEFKDSSLISWDLSAEDGDRTRVLWRQFYPGTKGIIFVVDSNDRHRIDCAKKELHKMLAETELRTAPLLVFANKQDLADAMSVSEVSERLGLHELGDRRWFNQAITATTGDGIYEGLEWLNWLDTFKFI